MLARTLAALALVTGALSLSAQIPIVVSDRPAIPVSATTTPASRPGTALESTVDLEKYRQQMQEQMRIDMNSSDEEWKILLPKIERVQSLQYAGVMLRILNGDVMSELRGLVASKEVTDAQLREKIQAWRSAVSRNREELARAQSELRDLITIRQEALLISRGILD